MYQPLSSLTLASNKKAHTAGKTNKQTHKHTIKSQAEISAAQNTVGESA